MTRSRVAFCAYTVFGKPLPQYRRPRTRVCAKGYLTWMCIILKLELNVSKSHHAMGRACLHLSWVNMVIFILKKFDKSRKPVASVFGWFAFYATGIGIKKKGGGEICISCRGWCRATPGWTSRWSSSLWTSIWLGCMTDRAIASAICHENKPDRNCKSTLGSHS